MNNNLNKNISVWRGDSTPPTDYHLWETSDGKIKTKINNEWKQVTSPTDKEHIDRAIYNISTLGVGTDEINYKIDHNNGITDVLTIQCATKDSAGLMSAELYGQLNRSLRTLFIGTKGNTNDIYLTQYQWDGQQYSYMFPIVCSTHHGLMSVEDKTKLDTNIYDLGYFERTGLAEQEAATAKIAGNNDIALIKYKYGAKSGLIIQQVGDFRTLQILLLDGRNQARWIVFSDSSRTNVVGVSRWNKCGITSLGYDSDNHKLNVRFLDDTLPDAGVTLPVAGESKWGLIDKATYDNAVALYTKLNNIKIKSITPANSNILKSYQLIDSNNNVLGETINIPKDSSIKTVEIADTKATIDSNGNIIKGSGDTALSIVYVLADGSYKIVNASLSKFLEESEIGNGLQVVNHKVSVLKDPTSEDFLKVTDKGISISGVKTAITDETQKYLPLRGGGTLYTNTSPNSIIFNPIDGSIISTSMEDFTRILPGQINLHNSGSSLNMNYQYGFMYNDTNLRDGLFIGSSAQKNGIQFKTATTLNTKFIQVSTFIPNRDNYAFKADGTLVDVSHIDQALCLDQSGNLHRQGNIHEYNPEIRTLKIGTGGIFTKSGIYGEDSQSAASKVRTWSQSGENIDLQNYLKCQYTNNGYKLYLTYPANNNLVDSSVTKFLDLYNKTETNTLLDKKFGWTSSEYNEDGSLTISFYKDKNSLTNRIDNVDILIRTSTRSGLMSPTDLTDLDTLTTSIKNLGHFNTEADAINYLKTLPICADTKIIHAHLTYGNKNNPSTITMIQNIKDSWTRQILFRDDKVQQRAIYFTNSERTEIRGIEDLQYLFGDRLKWDNNSHKYLLSQYGDTWNEQYTDPIPMVSTTTNGLMSKEDKVKLEDLNTWNYIGILSSWNGIAKLTTDSTEADILTALTITPLRGNKINTKTELFSILDQCAINKKFLKESSTNAHVFVEHIDSCYVIQILGNKAAVLNGNLVGTPVLRHITISANSNETLTVRKAPFEIKLEDIKTNLDNLKKSTFSHIADTNTFTTSPTEVKLNYTCYDSSMWGGVGSKHEPNIPAATINAAGIMTAADKESLENLKGLKKRVEDLETQVQQLMKQLTIE